MERRRTLGQYRAIDLVIFALLLAFFEGLILRAVTDWFPNELYTVSLAAPIVSIVYMRWGPWGILHAALAGFVFCLFSGANGEQYIIYCCGNIFSALSLTLLYGVGKERVRTGKWLGLLFPVLVQFLMHGGRALTALVLGAPLGSVADFFLMDSLSYVFTLVIAWIVRRLDGVYEDQKHYLLRLNSEKEKKEVKNES